MKRRIPLSPTQSAAFAMGRALLVFDTWSRSADIALDIDRAMLLDFAVMHPRTVRTVVPELDLIIRAHGLQKYDLSDAFAEKHFGTMRERFLTAIAELLSRDLLEEAPLGNNGDQLGMRISDKGRAVAAQFSSSLSLGIREVCTLLAEKWRRRNVRDLAREIQTSIPDERQFASELREPFYSWLVEAD